MRAPPLLLLTAAATLAAAAAAAACEQPAADCGAARCDACGACAAVRAPDAAPLCALRAPRQRARRLALLRLPHCCERSALAALDAGARAAVAAGGAACRAALLDLLALDALAAAVSCRFADLIARYDCRQPFSVIHDCQACEQSYRRWVCSALLPYFETEPSLSAGAVPSPTPASISDEPPVRGRRRRRARAKPTDDYRQSNDSLYYISAESVRVVSDMFSAIKSDSKAQLDNRLSRHRNRAARLELGIYAANASSRLRGPGAVGGRGRWRRSAGSGPGRPGDSEDWGPGRPDALVRVRPCMSICQEVEQRCPYFLPGDRAPSYPTQYAGEPTFLCADPKIKMTGEQERHATHGPADCCHWYCEGAVCLRCEQQLWHSAVDHIAPADVCEGSPAPPAACASVPAIGTSPAQRPRLCACLLLFAWLLHLNIQLLCWRRTKATASDYIIVPVNPRCRRTGDAKRTSYFSICDTCAYTEIPRQGVVRPSCRLIRRNFSPHELNVGRPRRTAPRTRLKLGYIYIFSNGMGGKKRTKGISRPPERHQCSDEMRKCRSRLGVESNCRLPRKTRLWNTFSGNRVRCRREGASIEGLDVTSSLRTSHFLSAICRRRRTLFIICSGYCNVRVCRAQTRGFVVPSPVTDYVLFKLRIFHRANL